jgi:4-diphosphocytidyl-2-C-methyl-D-erythritol kinase
MKSEQHRAYAKINIGLFVREKRPDGYHNIATVFHRIDLYDEIVFEKGDEIVVATTDPATPSDERNLCYKAAKLLREQLGVQGGVRISIRKNIPVGAGLGGGSSDAASVLRALPEFWGHTIEVNQLRRLALQLGSDVPYFLQKGTAVGYGRGDVLEYFELDVPYFILLCYPDVHVSTHWAYQSVISTGSFPEDIKQVVIGGMKTPSSLRENIRNDFEPIVFREFPIVMKLKEMMMNDGADFALMSGSGSSVFGFFSREQSALAVEKKLHAQGWSTVQTVPHFSPEE